LLYYFLSLFESVVFLSLVFIAILCTGNIDQAVFVPR